MTTITTEQVDSITSNDCPRAGSRTRRVEMITDAVQDVIASYVISEDILIDAHDWQFRGEIIGIANVSASSIAVTLRPTSLVHRGRNIG